MLNKIINALEIYQKYAASRKNNIPVQDTNNKKIPTIEINSFYYKTGFWGLTRNLHHDILALFSSMGVRLRDTKLQKPKVDTISEWIKRSDPYTIYEGIGFYIANNPRLKKSDDHTQAKALELMYQINYLEMFYLQIQRDLDEFNLNIMIGKNVTIGKKVTFGTFILIDDDVTIGNECTLEGMNKISKNLAPGETLETGKTHE